MGKYTRTRTEARVHDREIRRIAVSVDTLLRKQLGFPPAEKYQGLFDESKPVEVEKSIEYLRRVSRIEVEEPL